MPQPARMAGQQAAELARSLIKAAELFAATSPDLDRMRQSSSVWWPRNPDADALFRPAVEELVRSNPSQLSYSDTVPS